MSKNYYPAFLDLEGRPVVVIGGGEVAERKAEGLLKAGAAVTVVSPAGTDWLREKASAGAVSWLERAYEAGDLRGAWLAVAATDDRQVNEAVANEAAARAVLLNAVDEPALCSFIAPSVIHRGDLTIAVSTGGASPAAARHIREQLENGLADEYEALVDVVAGVRKTLREQGARAPAELWRQAVSPEVVSLVREGKLGEAKGRLFQALKNEPDAA